MYQNIKLIIIFLLANFFIYLIMFFAASETVKSYTKLDTSQVEIKIRKMFHLSPFTVDPHSKMFNGSLFSIFNVSNQKNRPWISKTLPVTVENHQRYSPSCKERNITIAICVPISRGNPEKRRVVRETWGTYGTGKGGSNILTFFVGNGKPNEDPNIQDTLDAESKQFGDIFQGDFVDSYENLTLKSQSILRWVYDNCNNTRYVLKGDDDVYINIPLLLKHLDRTSRSRHNKPFIMGNVQRGARPIRDKKNKWYMSKDQFGGNKYPDYMSGPVYSMTSSALKLLIDAIPSVPFLWLEDIYITGLLAGKANVERVHNGWISLSKPHLSGINSLNKYISGHRYSGTELRKIHTELLSLRNGTTQAKKGGSILAFFSKTLNLRCRKLLKIEKKNMPKKFLKNIHSLFPHSIFCEFGYFSANFKGK